MLIRTWILFIFTLIISLSLPKLVLAQVTINEFVPNGEEWVEFHNASSSAEYLKEYYIDDKLNGGQPKKKLTDLNISNPTFPYFVIGENYLNNDGDDILLLDPEGNIVSQYHYGSVPSADMPIGRFPDTTGGFAFLQSATRGVPNSSPKTDPTPTSTPSPTPIFTPSPSSSPSKSSTPAPKPTKSSTPKPTSSPVGIVLGQEEFLTSPVPFGATESPNPILSQEVENKEVIPPVALIFIFAGFVFVGISIFSFLKLNKNKYNDLDENSILRPKN